MASPEGEDKHKTTSINLGHAQFAVHELVSELRTWVVRFSSRSLARLSVSQSHESALLLETRL